MKDKILFTLLACLFLSNSIGVLGAIEIEVIGGINSISSPFSNIIGNISLKTDISSSSSAIINFSRDDILHNSIDLRLATNSDYFYFEFGPFIGITDDFFSDIYNTVFNAAPSGSEKPFIGFLGSLEFAYPGVIAAAFNASSSIGIFADSHKREEIGASVGFWLPFMIPSVSYNIKNFTNNNTNVTDSLSKLYASFEFYGKNSPAVFRIDAGYQWYNKNSFFAGAEIRWQISSTIKLIFGGEVPLLKLNEMLKGTRVTAGFSYSPMK